VAYDPLQAMKFELTILGCNSAIPANGRFPSSQVLNIQEQLFLIDCGEGTQMRLGEFHIRRMKINQIFISHLHGDHVFGLIGLLTSYSLMNRKEPLDIFSPAGLEQIIDIQLEMSQTIPTYPINFHHIDTTKFQCIFENKILKVYSIPLIHRIPTCGFLFREKPFPRHIIPEKITGYQIPFSKIDAIKNGADFVLTDGNIIPNSELTTPSPTPRSFAYCSDTAYSEKIINHIRKVDLLFHETTFLDEKAEYAKMTKHTTAKQAAFLAKKANVGKLITGHYSTRYKKLTPILEEAQAVFSKTELGEDGKVFDVPLKKME